MKNGERERRKMEENWRRLEGEMGGEMVSRARSLF